MEMSRKKGGDETGTQTHSLWTRFEFAFQACFQLKAMYDPAIPEPLLTLCESGHIINTEVSEYCIVQTR